MALRSLIRKLRIRAYLQRVEGTRPIASQDKMSSSAFARTSDAPFEKYDELLRSHYERMEKELRYAQSTRLVFLNAPVLITETCMIVIVLMLFSLFPLEDGKIGQCGRPILAGEAAALVVAFGGLCYIADNNRV